MFGSKKRRIIKNADVISSKMEEMNSLSWGRVLDIAKDLQHNPNVTDTMILSDELILIAQTNLSMFSRMGVMPMPMAGQLKEAPRELTEEEKRLASQETVPIKVISEAEESESPNQVNEASETDAQRAMDSLYGEESSGNDSEKAKSASRANKKDSDKAANLASSEEGSAKEASSDATSSKQRKTSSSFRAGITQRIGYISPTGLSGRGDSKKAAEESTTEDSSGAITFASESLTQQFRSLGINDVNHVVLPSGVEVIEGGLVEDMLKHPEKAQAPLTPVTPAPENPVDKEFSDALQADFDVIIGGKRKWTFSPRDEAAAHKKTRISRRFGKPETPKRPVPIIESDIKVLDPVESETLQEAAEASTVFPLPRYNKADQEGYSPTESQDASQSYQIDTAQYSEGMHEGNVQASCSPEVAIPQSDVIKPRHASSSFVVDDEELPAVPETVVPRHAAPGQVLSFDDEDQFDLDAAEEAHLTGEIDLTKDVPASQISESEVGDQIVDFDQSEETASADVAEVLDDVCDLDDSQQSDSLENDLAASAEVALDVDSVNGSVQIADEVEATEEKSTGSVTELVEPEKSNEGVEESASLNEVSDLAESTEPSKDENVTEIDTESDIDSVEVGAESVEINADSVVVVDEAAAIQSVEVDEVENEVTNSHALETTDGDEVAQSVVEEALVEEAEAAEDSLPVEDTEAAEDSEDSEDSLSVEDAKFEDTQSEDVLSEDVQSEDASEVAEAACEVVVPSVLTGIVSEYNAPDIKDPEPSDSLQEEELVESVDDKHESNDAVLDVDDNLATEIFASDEELDSEAARVELVSNEKTSEYEPEKPQFKSAYEAEVEAIAQMVSKPSGSKVSFTERVKGLFKGNRRNDEAAAASRVIPDNSASMEVVSDQAEEPVQEILESFDDAIQSETTVEFSDDIKVKSQDQFELSAEEEAPIALDSETDGLDQVEADADVEVQTEVDGAIDEKVQAESDIKADVEHEAQGEVDINVEPEDDVDPDTEIKASIDIDTEIDIDMDADTELEAEAGTADDVDSDAGIEAGLEADADTDVDAELAVEVDSNADIDTGFDIEAQNAIGFEVEGESDTEAETQSDIKSEAQDDSEIEAEPEPQVDREAEPVSHVELESENAESGAPGECVLESGDDEEDVSSELKGATDESVSIGTSETISFDEPEIVSDGAVVAESQDGADDNADLLAVAADDVEAFVFEELSDAEDNTAEGDFADFAFNSDEAPAQEALIAREPVFKPMPSQKKSFADRLSKLFKRDRRDQDSSGAWSIYGEDDLIFDLGSSEESQETSQEPPVYEQVHEPLVEESLAEAQVDEAVLLDDISECEELSVDEYQDQTEDVADGDGSDADVIAAEEQAAVDVTDVDEVATDEVEIEEADADETFVEASEEQTDEQADEQTEECTGDVAISDGADPDADESCVTEEKAAPEEQLSEDSAFESLVTAEEGAAEEVEETPDELSVKDEKETLLQWTVEEMINDLRSQENSAREEVQKALSLDLTDLGSKGSHSTSIPEAMQEALHAEILEASSVESTEVVVNSRLDLSSIFGDLDIAASVEEASEKEDEAEVADQPIAAADAVSNLDSGSESDVLTDEEQAASIKADGEDKAEETSDGVDLDETDSVDSDSVEFEDMQADFDVASDDSKILASSDEADDEFDGVELRASHCRHAGAVKIDNTLSVDDFVAEQEDGFAGKTPKHASIDFSAVDEEESSRAMTAQHEALSAMGDDFDDMDEIDEITAHKKASRGFHAAPSSLGFEEESELMAEASQEGPVEEYDPVAEMLASLEPAKKPVKKTGKKTGKHADVAYTPRNSLRAALFGEPESNKGKKVKKDKASKKDKSKKSKKDKAGKHNKSDYVTLAQYEPSDRANDNAFDDPFLNASFGEFAQPAYDEVVYEPSDQITAVHDLSYEIDYQSWDEEVFAPVGDTLSEVPSTDEEPVEVTCVSDSFSSQDTASLPIIGAVVDDEINAVEETLWDFEEDYGFEKRGKHSSMKFGRHSKGFGKHASLSFDEPIEEEAPSEAVSDFDEESTDRTPAHSKEDVPSEMGTFHQFYESRNGDFVVYEDEDGHLVSVKTSRLL